jgi:hypothetical protein
MTTHSFKNRRAFLHGSSLALAAIGTGAGLAPKLRRSRLRRLRVRLRVSRSSRASPTEHPRPARTATCLPGDRRRGQVCASASGMGRSRRKPPPDLRG